MCKNMFLREVQCPRVKGRMGGINMNNMEDETFSFEYVIKSLGTAGCMAFPNETMFSLSAYCLDSK